MKQAQLKKREVDLIAAKEGAKSQMRQRLSKNSVIPAPACSVPTDGEASACIE